MIQRFRAALACGGYNPANPEDLVRDDKGDFVLFSDVKKIKAENARLRAIIDTLTATAPATASLAVFLCSKCRESVDTVYEVGGGANVEHVCKKCVQN